MSTVTQAHAGSPLTLPLALTMGDPAGIGLDITLAAFHTQGTRPVPRFVFYGDAAALAARARQLGLSVPIAEVGEPAEGWDLFPTALPVIPVALSAPCRAGAPTSENAPAVIAAIEAATAAVLAGKAAGLVTNPIAKSVLYARAFAFPGHTEFLAHLAARHSGARAAHPVMMLASPGLRVVPLTVHVPLADVPRMMTRDLIDTTVRIVHAALIGDFGIAAPRIVVAGLNPHAGEAGTLGTEDRDIIAPAVAALVAAGLDITGPRSADTLFHAAARADYDAVVAMYHDQALIPIKTIAFDAAVNVTLGLPFVRTSPDHGTAFDIAGSGRASPESLMAALDLAAGIAARRSRPS